MSYLRFRRSMNSLLHVVEPHHAQSTFRPFPVSHTETTGTSLLRESGTNQLTKTMQTKTQASAQTQILVSAWFLSISSANCWRRVPPISIDLQELPGERQRSPCRAVPRPSPHTRSAGRGTQGSPRGVQPPPAKSADYRTASKCIPPLPYNSSLLLAKLPEECQMRRNPSRAANNLDFTV